MKVFERTIPRLDDLCVGWAALLGYWLTLAPGIPTGDSGELVTAAATLSLAHPTGYPLYLLSGYVFIQLSELLSFGTVSPALAMNFFSALTASAACVIVRRLVQTLVDDRLVAGATALLFAFSTSMWSQATVARVYALGALLLALALLELARLARESGGSFGRAWLYLGLGMANHTVMIVVAPLLVLASLRPPVDWRVRAAAALWWLPGLSLYAYVPIAASHDPVQDWGDPRVAERLIPYLSRESFWSKRYVGEAGDLWSVAAHYLDQIPVELGWLGMALLILGLASGRARRGVVLAGLYLFVANALLVGLHGSRQDIFYWSRYLISGWLGLVLIAGVGLDSLLQEMRAIGGRARSPALLASIALAAPLAAFCFGFARADRSGDSWAEDFSRAILESLAPDALLFAEEDNVLFPLSYLHHVEGLRPDVELVMQGINRMESKAIEPDRQPTYFTHPRSLGNSALELIPDGLVLRLVPVGSAFEGRAWQEVALESFEVGSEPRRGRYLDRSLIGNYYFLEALNRERREPLAAMRAVELLRAASFDNAVHQLNAGLLFERNLHFVPALAAFEAAAALDPKNELAVSRTGFWRAALDQASSVGDPVLRRQALAAALLREGRGDLAARLLDIEPALR